MRFFVRTVVQGFALALGAALFKKIQDRIGLGEPKDKEETLEQLEKKGKGKGKAKKPAEPELPPDPDLPG
jgi:hypothetical protein